MNKISIIKATKKHREFLIKSNSIIHEISEQDCGSEFAKRIDVDYFCKTPKFYCLIAEYNNIPVGTILYSKMYWADDGEVLWVSQMFVEKEYRKHGVAIELYKALKAFSPEANVIACATGKGNATMNKVLKGIGFKIIDMNFFAKKI